MSWWIKSRIFFKTKLAANRIFRIALLLLLVIGVVLAVIYLKSLVKQKDTTQSNSSALATAQQIDKIRTAKVTAKLLDEKDYDSYQGYASNLAQQYLGTNDYVNARRILTEAITNVPPDKVQASTYMTLLQALRAQKDTAAQKDCLSKLINILSKTGRTNEASEYQKMLDSLQ